MSQSLQLGSGSADPNCMTTHRNIDTSHKHWTRLLEDLQLAVAATKATQPDPITDGRSTLTLAGWDAARWHRCGKV